MNLFFFFFTTVQLQPQEISPPPTANLDRSNDKVYENVTGLVKAVIEMSSKIQPAPPEEYVPMVKVMESHRSSSLQYPVDLSVLAAVYGHRFIFIQRRCLICSDEGCDINLVARFFRCDL